MEQLLAGAARTVITPPDGYVPGIWGLRQGRSTGVHRDLHARSLVLDNGTTQLAILSLEVTGLTVEIVRAIKSHITRLTGIPADHVLLNSTHNHTSPNVFVTVPDEWALYATYLGELASGCVAQAFHSRTPASIGHDYGDLPGWTVNRQYPDRPVDTKVGVLTVETADGAPLAKVVNYACHGVCDGGQYLEWSGDFSGEMSVVMEAAEPGVVALHLQGAAGDVHPFDWWFGNHESKHMHTHEDTARLGRALAGEAMRVSAGTGLRSVVALDAKAAVVEMPRHRVGWTVDAAQTLHEKLRGQFGAYRGDTWPVGTTTANAAELHPEQYGTGRNELNLATNQDMPPIQVQARGFRIGDLLISASPGELFNELGRAIKDGFSGGRPWVASYSDDYVGYISTRKPHEEISDVPLDQIVDMKRFRRYYGTTTSPFAPEAGEALVDRSIAVLQQL
jgi:neutral ceramidase